MKSQSLYLLLLCAAMLVFSTCKKDTDVNMESFKIVKEVEKVTAGTTSATITGMYEYSGRIDGIKVRVGTSDQLFGSDVYVAEMSGKSYSVSITGLRSGTKYHYRYEVDYGAKEDYLTEISEFTTQSESPTVKTLEMLALDSTTFRVKCEVVADGGSEVSERGICWNTYGDPTMDDETMQHATGGLGQYTIRLEHLALGKKYYVRAYAKSMSGVGFGEEMEFETTSTPGMPVSIALSCNPEVGGTVSGAGSYAAGTQCTVTATANPTYTFVNWTENGTQVASDAAYTFTVSVERNLVANFTKQTCVISAQVVPENSGSVEGAGGYNPEDVCTLTATAKTGYTFVNWTKSGNVVSTEAEYTFTVTESATYVAHFQTKSYTISVSSSPNNGGTVTGGGTMSYGQTCTVQATPAEGYIFANWTDDGDVVSTEANYTFTVTGNRSLVANFKLVPVGAIKGLFTIDENGNQVFFSKGNLQYNMGSSMWRFAEHQYDTIGRANSSIINNNSTDWIDLLGWGTGNNPTMNSGNDDDYVTFVDWGVNAISNGGNQAEMWNTLSIEEWFFLFNGRYDANSKYGIGNVNGVRGLIFLPENWTCPIGLTFNPGFSSNDGDWSHNSYTVPEWQLMEDAGAIFLPDAGRRQSNVGAGGLVCWYENIDGCYWSFSRIEGNLRYIKFQSTNLDLQDTGCGGHFGFSVRLVHSAQ